MTELISQRLLSIITIILMQQLYTTTLRIIMMMIVVFVVCIIIIIIIIMRLLFAIAIAIRFKQAMKFHLLNLVLANCCAIAINQS